MAAALECWSSRASSADEEMAEQGLIRLQDRSEDPVGNVNSMQKRLQRLSRNVSEAIASLKNSLNLDPARDQSFSGQPVGAESCRKQIWGNVVRKLTLVYPGSQLPEKLMSSIRKHYDSLPLSYAQAGFEMKDVFLHMKLIEQATMEDHPAINVQQESDDEAYGSFEKLTFACCSSVSWTAMSGTFDNASICCKKIQMFEGKDFTLGIIMLLVQPGQEKLFRTRIENALKLSLKKQKGSSMKLPFGLCGCQKDISSGGEQGEMEEDGGEQVFSSRLETSGHKVQIHLPLASRSIVISVDELQRVQSGWDGIRQWLLNQGSLEFVDQIGHNTFKGVYKGKKVRIEKIKGCEKGNAYEFELWEDLLELMICGHKNVLQFYGVCLDGNHGLCVLTKLMEGGSVNDLILKKKKLKSKEIIRIAADVAEGLRFMNDHGLAYRDLNTQKILLDKHGNACLGNMGIVAISRSAAEAMEYGTDGYRWLAPEVC